MKAYKPEIIAEIGCNWLGDWDIAKSMIRAAASAGVDYVKTQTWQSKNLSSSEIWKDRIKLYEDAELNNASKHKAMMSLCNEYNVKYLTSLFNAEDIYILPEDISEIKIPGIEGDNKELIDACCDRFDHIYISTCGMSIESINLLILTLLNKDQSFTVMHGVYMYPCKLVHSQMSRIRYLLEMHNDVGYSDHTEGIEAAVYALANGCSVVEKHFTTDRSLGGPDNRFSCLPEDMAEICEFRDSVVEMNMGLEPDQSFVVDNYKRRWCGKDDG